ncbi:MAG: hypothetical protein P9X22_01455 [Candidatus Zapsychrus exili]|nr:hypothetical protein [Candidatus Zapsychrus exili]
MDLKSFFILAACIFILSGCATSKNPGRKTALQHVEAFDTWTKEVLW